MSAQYSIVAQEAGRQLDPTMQRAISGMTVHFTDAHTGVSDSIFVPDDYYSPENVAAMIRDRLDRIRAVHNLTE